MKERKHLALVTKMLSETSAELDAQLKKRKREESSEEKSLVEDLLRDLSFYEQMRSECTSAVWDRVTA